MAVVKNTKVDYSKVIGGLPSSFGYEYGADAPKKVSLYLPVNKSDAQSVEIWNGSLSLSVATANRAEAKEAVLAAVNAAFDEIDNIFVNFENPEA